MNVLVVVLIIVLSGCAARLSPEEAAWIEKGKADLEELKRQ